jgi:predicted  nucleic acid-binding Zn-ribbon protein
MTDLHDQIVNIGALSKSLMTAMTDFLGELNRLEPNAAKRKAKLEAEIGELQAELEKLTEKVKSKKEEHEQVLASLDVLNQRKAEILKMFDVPGRAA